MPIITELPQVLKPYYGKELTGLFVGGCVERGDGSSFRASAHSHVAKNKWIGWICVRGAKRINDEQLMIHELAHVITLKGHTAEWRTLFVELGGDPKEAASYIRKPRA